MAYELHINRSGRPIPEGELRQAVAQVRGLRISDAPSTTVTNPKTGEMITIRRSGPSVELLEAEGWTHVFRFHHGGLSFPVRFDAEDPLHPVRVAAATLARLLGAEILGDEGERYDW